MHNHNIEILFADLLYTVNLNNMSYYKNKIVEKVTQLSQNNHLKNNWFCNTFNTLNNYSLTQDKEFDKLLAEITHHCRKFSKEFGVNDKHTIKIKDAWINLARENDYQELHNHVYSHFSAVFYVNVPDQSGNTILFSRNHNNMFPLPLDTTNTLANSKTYHYSPKENDLIIFQSDIYHMVEQNKSNENRVTVSINFLVE